MTRLAFVSAAVLALLSGCGGDDGEPQVVTRDGSMDDAPSTPTCLAEASYTPAIGADEQGGTDYPATEDEPHNITFAAALNADELPDDLVLDLWADFGVFSGGDIHTGDFVLDGEEADYGTCGACVLVAADDGAQAAGQWYVAQSGMLVLTNVTDRLTGTLTNVMFASADTDTESGWPAEGVNDDCHTQITSATFDGVIEPGEPAAAGKSRRVRVRLRRD